MNEIDEVRADRNVLVHGLWGTESEPGTALVQTIRLDQAEMAKTELVIAADLDHLIGDILGVSNRVLHFLRRHSFYHNVPPS